MLSRTAYRTTQSESLLHFGLLFLGLYIGFWVLFAWVILLPLRDAATAQKQRWRLYTCDFFPLTLLVSLPLAFSSTTNRWHVYVRRWWRFGNTIELIACLIVVALVIYVWLRVAGSLSKAGVSNRLKRCVFQVTVLPATVFGSVSPLVSLYFFADSLLSRLYLLLLLPFTAYPLYKCSKWVVSHPSTATVYNDEGDNDRIDDETRL